MVAVAFAGVLGLGARGTRKFKLQLCTQRFHCCSTFIPSPVIVCSVYGKSLWNLMLSSSYTFPPSALSRRRSSCECISLICVTEAPLEKVNKLPSYRSGRNLKSAKCPAGPIKYLSSRKTPAHSTHHSTHPDLPCVSSRHHHHLHSFSLSPSVCTAEPFYL